MSDNDLTFMLLCTVRFINISVEAKAKSVMAYYLLCGAARLNLSFEVVDDSGAGSC